MSIKTSQAILKYFISLVFGLRWAQKTKPPVLWHLKLFSTRLPVKVFKALNGRQFYILSKFHNIEKFQCHKNISSSEPSVNQPLDLRSVEHFRIAWLVLIDISLDAETIPSLTVRNCAIIYHYVLRLKNVSYCVLCCILYWLLLDDQESANERYRSTVKDLLLPHTVSQKNKKLNTVVLDETIVPHIKIKITEIPLEKKLSTALNTVNPNVPLVNWIKSYLLRLTPISSQRWKMITCFYCGFIKGLPFICKAYERGASLI